MSFFLHFMRKKNFESCTDSPREKKIFFIFFLFFPQIYLPVGKIKKRGVIDGLACRIDFLSKMLKNGCFLSISPPPEGGEGQKWVKIFFSMFLHPIQKEMTIKRKIGFRSPQSCLFGSYGPARYWLICVPMLI